MNDYSEVYPGLCVGAAPNDWYKIWEQFDVIVSLCSVGITPLPSGKMRVSWFIDDWEAPEDVNHLWGLVGLIVKLVRDGERVLAHCLSWHTSVYTEDGRISIGELVNKKVKCRVLSLLPNGSFGWKNVTNWYKNELGDRKMLRLSLRHRGQYGRGINITADHPVLTPIGWCVAGDLKTGDLVCCGEVGPNKLQSELIDGTMLGDASVSKRRILSFAQADMSYAKLKQLALATLLPRGEIMDKRYISPQARLQWQAYSLTRVWSAQQRERWYFDDKKRVPRDIELTDLTLAAWYLDDGGLNNKYANCRPNARIASVSFAYDDLKWLSAQLDNRGLPSTITARGDIYLRADGIDELMRRIGRFIPPEMRRKATVGAPDFEISAWNLGNAIPWFDDVIVSDSTMKIGQSVYCIDVEDTHNFVTPGGVVHNCGAGLNRSGLIAALAYRELADCSAAEAEDHIKASRPGALSNPYFLTFIRTLDGKIDESTTTFKVITGEI